MSIVLPDRGARRPTHHSEGEFIMASFTLVLLIAWAVVARF